MPTMSAPSRSRRAISAAVVANYAAGRGDSEHAVALERIGEVLEEAMRRVRRIIEKLCEP